MVWERFAIEGKFFNFPEFFFILLLKISTPLFYLIIGLQRKLDNMLETRQFNGQKLRVQTWRFNCNCYTSF